MTAKTVHTTCKLLIPHVLLLILATCFVWYFGNDNYFYSVSLVIVANCYDQMHEQNNEHKFVANCYLALGSTMFMLQVFKIRFEYSTM
jgi:hypothetical protein